MDKIKIILSGGGTGGHIYPAVAVAEALQRRLGDGVELLFVGAEGKMEMEKIPALGYRIEGLPVAGLQRRLTARNLSLPFKVAASLRKARRVIRSFGADVVVGFGGYASAPVLWSAQRMGIPTLIQEQNSYAGVTNKLLASRARRICVAYEGMERFFPADKIILTGNPVRSNITDTDVSIADARRELGFEPDRELILVVGGSLGARTINESVATALKQWTDAGARVLWQTGKYYADECRAIAEPFGDAVKATPFISRMDLAYRAATLVVSRAGAGTISELQLLGKCAVLVPSPNVAEDHQRHNAEALSTRGAAVMVLDADARAQLGPTVAELLADRARRESISKRCGEMALRGADEKIIDKISEIIGK